jgi:hypothetical protein
MTTGLLIRCYKPAVTLWALKDGRPWDDGVSWKLGETAILTGRELCVYRNEAELVELIVPWHGLRWIRAHEYEVLVEDT